jgi:hypothetical protein
MATPNRKADRCADALRAFAEHRLANWRGLPACTLAEVAAHWTLLDDQAHPGRIGHRSASRTSAQVHTYDEPVDIWFDGEQVFLLLVEYPEFEGWPELLKQVGEPVAKLDSYLGTLLIPGSEWVYPERGLTLYVNPENRALLRLAVYAPTTLERYEAELRLSFKVRLLPLPEDD